MVFHLDLSHSLHIFSSWNDQLAYTEARSEFEIVPIKAYSYVVLTQTAQSTTKLGSERTQHPRAFVRAKLLLRNHALRRCFFARACTAKKWLHNTSPSSEVRRSGYSLLRVFNRTTQYYLQRWKWRKKNLRKKKYLCIFATTALTTLSLWPNAGRSTTIFLGTAERKSICGNIANWKSKSTSWKSRQLIYRTSLLCCCHGMGVVWTRSPLKRQENVLATQVMLNGEVHCLLQSQVVKELDLRGRRHGNLILCAKCVAHKHSPS